MFTCGLGLLYKSLQREREREREKEGESNRQREREKQPFIKLGLFFQMNLWFYKV